MEAFTIQSVPYYKIADRSQFYLIGSTFYMLYFVISFPMFTRYVTLLNHKFNSFLTCIRIDETGDKWDLSRTSLESLGSAMIVFCLFISYFLSF